MVKIDKQETLENRIITSPLKAVKKKCLDCCCGSLNEVKICTIQKCPLYAFRLGENPYRVKRELSEEQRLAAKARFAEYRNKLSIEKDKTL